MEGAEPIVRAGGGRGGKADFVVTAVGGCECEAAGCGAGLEYDTVVVVEEFLGGEVSLSTLQLEMRVKS